MTDNSYQQKEEWAFSGLVLRGLWGFLAQQKRDLGEMKLMCYNALSPCPLAVSLDWCAVVLSVPLHSLMLLLLFFFA